MESLDAPANFVDSLLSFLSNMEDCNDEKKPRKALSSSHISNGVLSPDDPIRSSHEIVEEELEWISNKDAFPALETFVDVLSEHPRTLTKQQSPVSVLESTTTSRHSDSSSNSNENCSILISCCGNLKPPRRARSKRRLRRRQICCVSQPNNKKGNANEKFEVGMRGTSIGRKCQHCGVVKTPQWREGPLGPKTLCNACGVRYKSGRLVPEYRPANSPTFTSELHSNSHRKVMEMRRLKQMMGMGMVKPVETV